MFCVGSRKTHLPSFIVGIIRDRRYIRLRPRSETSMTGDIVEGFTSAVAEAKRKVYQKIEHCQAAAVGDDPTNVFYSSAVFKTVS